MRLKNFRITNFRSIDDSGNSSRRATCDSGTAAWVSAPTPTMSAICCRIGEAPTSCPVLRSCRLSLEIVAHANTIAVTNSAKAISACELSGEGERKVARIVAKETIDRIPTPEMGLFDAPMSPAM